MLIKYFAATFAAAVTGAAAQLSTYDTGSSDIAFAVNVPSTTSSSDSGSIYIQLTGSTNLEWFAVGQGSSMTGANMMVVYAASASNVTLSPRLGTGYVMPDYNSAAQVTLLEGTGISNGIMTANIRCDSCLSWSGGSMDPTDASSNWIWASKSGNALDSTDMSETISVHDNVGTFTFDLTHATGGDSSNPFISSSSTSGSSTTSSSGSTPPSSSSSSSGSGSSSDSGSTGSSSVGSYYAKMRPTRIAHATIMCLVFAVLFPLFGLTIYLPMTNKVRYVHAPLQIVALILALIGLGAGIRLGKDLGGGDNYTGYHPNIGYIAVGYLTIVQPLVGLKQHLHYRRTKTRHTAGPIHTWGGRAAILLGIVNGGLGFKFTGPVGSPGVPKWAVILYSIVAIIVAIIWIVVVFFSGRSDQARRGSSNTISGEPLDLHSSSSSGSRSPSGAAKEARRSKRPHSTHAERAARLSRREQRKETTEGSGAFA